jgi:hypothetical protein
MPRPIPLAVALVVAAAGPAVAQSKKPADRKVSDPPGYKVHTLHGFTVVVSDQVANADTSAYTRKPLEALELELKNVAGLMTPKAVNALRAVPVWAEWDERVALSNGRKGASYATYYGGNQSGMLARGMNPQKAKCVVVHLTKALTEAYQRKDRPESLLLLHEMAHAVHDQLLTGEHPGVKAAYQQAMARKLYDKSLYYATNHHEFFAEMTCAFLDRLDYFPRTREDLRKHDPETYKAMDAIWGKAAADGGKPRTAARPPDGSDEFRLDVPLSAVRFGRQLAGPAVDAGSPDGNVTALLYWRDSQPAELRRAVRWHDELGGYGLRVVLLSAHYRDEKAAADERLTRLTLPLPVLGTTYMPTKEEGQGRAEPGGHLAVFDPSGKCVFRGRADAGEVYVREQVGAKVFAGLGLPADDVPKPLRPAADALLAGEPIPAVLAKAAGPAAASDEAVSGPAKKLVAALTEPGRKALADAERAAKAEPVEAFLAAERVAAGFKGTAVGRKADALVQSLRTNRAVADELKARKELDAVRKIEAVLNAQGESFDPTDPKFQRRFAPQLAQLRAAVDALKKKHPAARATKEAEAIAAEFGV